MHVLPEAFANMLSQKHLGFASIRKYIFAGGSVAHFRKYGFALKSGSVNSFLVEKFRARFCKGFAN